MLSGMINGVNPDQTQEQSDLDLHCLHMAFCQKLWCSKFTAGLLFFFVVVFFFLKFKPSILTEK